MRLVAKWDDVISKYKTDLESLGGFKADCESIPVVDLLNIDWEAQTQAKLFERHSIRDT